MMKSDEGKNLIIQARSANAAIYSLKAINEGNQKEGFLFARQAVGGIPTCTIKRTIERVIKGAGKRLEAVGKSVYASL